MNGTSILTRFYKAIFSNDTTLFEVDTDKMKDRGIDKGDLVLVDKSRKPGKGDIGVSEDRELVKGKGRWKVVFVVKGR